MAKNISIQCAKASACLIFTINCIITRYLKKLIFRVGGKIIKKLLNPEKYAKLIGVNIGVSNFIPDKIVGHLNRI